MTNKNKANKMREHRQTKWQNYITGTWTVLPKWS